MTLHDLLRSLVFIPVFFGIPAVVWLLRKFQRDTHAKILADQIRDYEKLKSMRCEHLANYKQKLLSWETQALCEADDTSTYNPFIILYKQAIEKAQADIDEMENKIVDLRCRAFSLTNKKG